MKSPKKLIEVALPLDDINAEIKKQADNPFLKNHPRSLHKWWARRQLAATRAVVFAQAVNDPGGERGWGAYKGQTKEDARRERERLFNILRELVKWENTANEEVLEQAREEIRRSWRETCRINSLPEDTPLPPLHDPFAGGGAIPLEAQRLGFRASASDLNPVAVLINKAMIEIPPRFAGRVPVGPHSSKDRQMEMPKSWPGATGLAEDIRRYASLLAAEVESNVQDYFPPVQSDGAGKGSSKPIAYIWARTVESPSPVHRGVHVPLLSSYWLSKDEGKEVYVEPVVNGTKYRFVVKNGPPGDPDYTSSGTKIKGGFRCLLSNTPIPFNYIAQQGRKGKIKQKLVSILAEVGGKRVFVSPADSQEEVAQSLIPKWVPSQELPGQALGFRVQKYGMTKWADIFTNRQLVTAYEIFNHVRDVKNRVIEDAVAAGYDDAESYAVAVQTYLALATSRWLEMYNSLSTWNPSNRNIRGMFAMQTVSMKWDFAELHPFSSMASWVSFAELVTNLFENLHPDGEGRAFQMNASSACYDQKVAFSTDPPYSDNIGYAGMSDFFYSWLRLALRDAYPDIFSTIVVPKDEELVAEPHRHDSKAEAHAFFLNGMTDAMRQMSHSVHSAFPITIFYAYKQADTKDGSTTSVGWETFLEAVISAGLSIRGTWPMQTEREDRSRGIGSNALASSIVLVCRPRPLDAPTATKREFLRELRETIPDALEDMIGGAEGVSPIAPVDLAQAAIGPGMAVYSHYAEVLEADGRRMPVGTALAYINEEVDRYFSEAEGEMDADTRFCVDWFQQYGFKPGPFGEADVLARAKGTSVEGLTEAGVLQSGAGKVRLLKTGEYPDTWDPVLDRRKPVWEACHQLARALGTSEAEAGRLLAGMPEMQEPVRQLAYRLYTLCERKGWAEEARTYNMLVGSWHGVVEQSHESGRVGTQTDLGL